MKVAQKLDLFSKNSSLLPIEKLSSSDLHQLEINSPPSMLQNFVFEYGVSVESPMIGKGGFIGAYSYINNGGYIRSNCFIGRFCSIGRRVTIAAGTHSYDGVSTHPKLMNKKKKQRKFTVLENDVWIGDGAVIMQGVNVGQGAIVGANAVVTKNVEPYSIMGGVPAKTIKYRFAEPVRELLLSRDLFDLPLADLVRLGFESYFDKKSSGVTLNLELFEEIFEETNKSSSYLSYSL